MNATTQPATSKVIVVPNVLASYLYVSRPKDQTDATTGKKRSTYEVDGVFPATHPAFELIRNTQREVARAAWGEDVQKFALGPKDANGQSAIIEMPNWQGILTTLSNEAKIPLRDGNKRKKIEEPYEGNFYLAARSTRQPRVVVTRGGVNVDIQPGDPQYPISGDYVTLVVEIWAQGVKGKPSPYGQRINCQFQGIQFLAKGEKRFGGGGRVASLDEFGISPTEADAPPPGAPVSAGGPSLV